MIPVLFVDYHDWDHNYFLAANVWFVYRGVVNRFSYNQENPQKISPICESKSNTISRFFESELFYNSFVRLYAITNSWGTLHGSPLLTLGCEKRFGIFQKYLFGINDLSTLPHTLHCIRSPMISVSTLLSSSTVFMKDINSFWSQRHSKPQRHCVL